MTSPGLLQRVERLAERFAGRAVEYDRAASFPTDDIEDLRSEGLLGLMAPARLGGMGCGFLDYVRVGAVLAQGSGSTALIFNMHAAVTGALAGVPDELARALGAGEEFFAVRDRVLSAAASGALYGVAISEREAGSRLSRMGATYELEDGGYRLRGEKSVCSGAGHLDAYLVAARAADQAQESKVSYFLVPAGDGLEVGATWDPLGMRATASNPVVLDVVVPADCLLTGVEGLAVPLAYAMPQWLVASYAAVYVGLAEAAVSEAVGHLNRQRPVRRPGPPAWVRGRLGRAQAATDAARLVLEHAARLVDTSPGDPEANRWVYQAKLVAGDTAMEVAAVLAEACGLSALGRGSALERIFRDARCGAIMPPRSDVCADYLGTTALGGDPMADMEDPPW